MNHPAHGGTFKEGHHFLEFREEHAKIGPVRKKDLKEEENDGERRPSFFCNSLCS